MNGAELIECGRLMETQARGVVLAPSELMRLKELQRRAKLELPHDDPSTPNVDEGETDIARKLRVDGEWQDRLIAVEKKLEAIACAVAGAAAAELPELIAGALKR